MDEITDFTLKTQNTGVFIKKEEAIFLIYVPGHWFYVVSKAIRFQKLCVSVCVKNSCLSSVLIVRPFIVIRNSYDFFLKK